MSTVIIASSAPFGAMTSQSISRLVSMRTTLTRLQDAIATASAGYQGVPGTEFEGGAASTPVNLFGVQPSDTPGEQGSAYSYAMGRLNEEFDLFWTAAEPYLAQLDNGAPAF